MREQLEKASWTREGEEQQENSATLHKVQRFQIVTGLMQVNAYLCRCGEYLVRRTGRKMQGVLWRRDSSIARWYHSS